ncbi:MAG: ribonuclease P protein component [Chloroflexota bacterium]|nr:ribonuclease P protein component [Chloroflexota bacterium]
MKRYQRLRPSGRFGKVRREGKCWAARLMVVCVLPNNLDTSRFGFSVSKRVGKAVVRNRVRRRIREVVRLRQHQIAPGWDIVFIARSPIARANYGEVELTCDRLLDRAGLWLAVPGPSEEINAGMSSGGNTGL